MDRNPIDSNSPRVLEDILGLEPIFKRGQITIPRMSRRYDFKQFEADIDAAQPLLNRVREQGIALMQYVKDRTSQFASVEDVLLVGSTSPDRMTCVIDPVTPDNKFPCDFDLVIISNGTLARDEQKAILTSAFDESTIKRATIWNKKRTPYVDTWVNKFPVNMIVAPSDSTSLPMLYANHTAVSDRERRTTQSLRLYAMRTGTYGGFTRGLKGIALEQIAKSTDDFREALECLHEKLSADTFWITNPANDDNLVKRVSMDIQQRLRRDLTESLIHNAVPAMPYSIHEWDNAHPGMMCFRFLSEDCDPHRTYQAVQKILLLHDAYSSHLVIPQYQSNEVLVAASVENQDRAKFLDSFYSTREQLFPKSHN